MGWFFHFVPGVTTCHPPRNLISAASRRLEALFSVHGRVAFPESQSPFQPILTSKPCVVVVR